MRRLTCIVAAALLIAAVNKAAAQPALDGHNTGTATSGTTTTFTATTGSNPQQLIAVAAVRATGTTNPALTISGCSLSWSSLGTAAQFNNGSPKGTAVYVWTAQASSNLSACTITVTSDQTIQNSSAAYCSFSGINTSNAFDPGATPATTSTNTTGTGSTMTVSLTTSLAHSTMVTASGQTSANMGGTTVTPAGAAACANVTNSGGLNFSNAYVVYKTFTSAQGATSFGNNTSQPYYSIVGTALTADAPLGRSRIIQ